MANQYLLKEAGWFLSGIMMFVFWVALVVAWVAYDAPAPIIDGALAAALLPALLGVIVFSGHALRRIRHLHRTARESELNRSA